MKAKSRSCNSTTKDFPLLGFKGIPYASPPTEDRRFERPISHPGWQGTLKADKTIKCPQVVKVYVYYFDD